jgi:hypothetical protein
MRNRFIVFCFSVLLMFGCAAKLGTADKSVGRDSADTKKVLSDNEITPEINPNILGKQDTKKKDNHSEVTGPQNDSQEHKGDNNNGPLSGGGIYLTIITIVALGLPPVFFLTIIALWLRSKRGWSAFNMLMRAHTNIASREAGSSIPSDVINEFKQMAQANKSDKWLKRHNETIDLFDRT